ncbi:phospholipid-binding lipoprotein MlaA [uncultured Gammaproteobacteria bacterium]
MNLKMPLLSCAILAMTVGSVSAQTQMPTAATAQAQIKIPKDYFEPVNRVMFRFNETVVDYIVDPAAWALDKVTPGFVQHAAWNMYENISEPEFIFTNLLAGYPKAALVSVGRFGVNSTVGLAGIFDVATPIGLERRTTEVSESMCKVGIPPGPYIVLPLIGPTNLFSGGILGATLAAEWYVLSLVSAALAAADAVFDVSVSVASLRHVRDIPGDHNPDHYALQQQEFWDYVKAGCTPSEAKTAANGIM